MSSISLENRIAIVTGANSGIGRAIVLAMAVEKPRLALVARRKAPLEETAERARGAGAEVTVIQADLSIPSEPQRVVSAVVDRFGGIDFLVNNAGIAVSRRLEETTLEEWDAVMNLNLRAPFLLAKAALPHLRRSEVPMILNTSSVAGRKGYANQSAYAASKHGLMGLMKALAREVMEEGIRVAAVAPGGVATEMVGTMRPDLDTSVLIAPEEVAEAALFLLTYRGKGAVDEVNIRRANSTPWD